MTQQNDFQLDIPEADLKTIKEAALTLNNTLGPHLISISNAARRELPKMGPRSIDFVEKAQEYSAKYPNLIPAFLSQTLFDNDMKAVSILRDLQRTMRPLADSIDDSLLLAGSEAYQAALIFYRSVKMAADQDELGAKTVRDDLATRFPSSRRSLETEETEADQ
ncbi:hypothetical protein [Halioxenophilus sp. WMMB6]|uniref:hypothetical protein n=1 Tax=Halioxenophilus sp. WMMB6 TaxID=3073815 RepID=UPI00295E7984|nr:hypothetical protein [Halioxenophilus sp. WMMB6]